MNWDYIAGNWKQLNGKLKTQWGKLTDDQLSEIGGRKDQLIGKLQQVYGSSKEAAEQEIDEWASRLSGKQSEGYGHRREPAQMGDSQPNRGDKWRLGSPQGIEGGVDALCARVQAQPLTSLAIAVGAGLLLGMILARR
jgi:uncharacterized protein YjbJ (UPF0337 family)